MILWMLAENLDPLGQRTVLCMTQKAATASCSYQFLCLLGLTQEQHGVAQVMLHMGLHHS